MREIEMSYKPTVATAATPSGESLRRAQGTVIRALSGERKDTVTTVLEHRIDLTAAAVYLSKVYEHIGVPSEDIGRLYIEQTEGTDETPLTVRESVIFTIGAAEDVSDLEVGVDDGVRIAQKRRTSGQLIFKNSPFTARTKPF